MGSVLGSASVRQPPSQDQEPRISIAVLGAPSPASPRRKHPQSVRDLHASLPLLRPRTQILQAGLQAQAFLRAHRAHEAQGAQKGIPHPHRGAPACCPPAHRSEAPLGLAIGSTLILLAPVLLAVELLVYHSEGREKVAEEEKKEGEATHEHLQGLGTAGVRTGRSRWNLPCILAPWLTCHSLHSGSRAKLNSVSALKSCQNWGEGSLFSKCGVRWDSDPEVDTQGVDGNTQV